MGSTTRYQWPYPEESDVPDVPADVQNLATSVEETIGTLDDRLTTLDGLSGSVFQVTILTKISSTTPQTIGNALWTPVAFDYVQYNMPQSMPGFVAQSPTRITCYQAGQYRLSGFAGFVQNNDGSRAVAVRVNGPGSSYPAIHSAQPPADMPWYGSVNVECRVNKNDYFELVVRQSSGGPLKMDAILPRFSMQRIA